ncbi:MAG: hypothetical protein OXI01_06580 [Albidovulum sp.]|nr:hypothetical protein [Albidovulum sp.]
MNVPARVAEGPVVGSVEEWREIVEDFEREGVTAAAYCDGRGSRPRTLLRWRRHGSPASAAGMPASVPEGGIWLATAPPDMRKSFNGLAALVRNDLDDEIPLKRSRFVGRSGGTALNSRRLAE